MSPSIQPFVSNLDRRVFALSNLPEEVIAVLFAYYSRSRDDLRTNLCRLLADESLAVGCQQPSLEFTQKKASEFHEKWVVGFGHSSVAEHASVHLAIENVSILASKAIEDLRLGSFTEKSTRYVVFDTGSYVDLPELPDSLQNRYRESCSNLFRTYLELFPHVQEYIRKKYPQQDRSEASWQAATRSKTLDLLRGLLPASTRTNLGVSANARAMAALLNKMYGSPLREVRQIASEMHTEALTIAPTLLKYVAPRKEEDVEASKTSKIMASLCLQPDYTTRSLQSVRLLRADQDALKRVTLALLYETGCHATDLIDRIDGSKAIEQIYKVISERGPHDPIPRAFEASSITVELELDYGAYRDLQRHRMLSPFTQPLTCLLGALTPKVLIDAEVASEYEEALLRASRVWLEIAKDFPFEAQYAVPLAYRTCVLWTLNLRELGHIIELRSSKQGHASYRQIAQELYREVCKTHPWLTDLFRVDLNEYGLGR